MITPLAKPFKPQGGIAVLRGNLAPDGAVLKPSAATPKLMKHQGRAVVFEDIEDLHARIDDPKLDVDETDVLVLKNCGPKGYPGMAEVGNFALPAKMLQARASPTWSASPTRGCRAPPTAPSCCTRRPRPRAGGPLALVENGDLIELDVAEAAAPPARRRRGARRAPRGLEAADAARRRAAG